MRPEPWPWGHKERIREMRVKADHDTAKVASQLQGTADSIEEACNRIGVDWPDEDCLYGIVERCGVCGWWERTTSMFEEEESENGLACEECFSSNKKEEEE